MKWSNISSGMLQNIASNNTNSSVDTDCMSLRRRRRARICFMASSCTTQVDVSRHQRRRMRTTRATTTHALPLVFGVFLLLHVCTSDAFVIQPRIRYLPTGCARGCVGDRSTGIVKRAHNVPPNRHRQPGVTSTPPRNRDFRTLFGSASEDDPTSADKECIESSEDEKSAEMISSNSTAFNSSAADAIEETPAARSDIRDTSDDAVQVNGTINVTGAIEVDGDAQVENLTLNEVQSDDSGGQSDENQPEDGGNDERLVQLRQRATAYVAKLPLSQILRRLDKRGLRYGPSSSQEELELMLVDALVSERRDNNAVANVGTGGSRRSSSRSAVIDDDAYVEEASSNEPRRSSRRQSRRRLSNRERRRRRLAQEEPIVTKTIRDVAKAASKVVEPVDRVVSETLWGVVEGNVGNKAKSKVKRVGRKAKRVAVDVAGNVVGGVGDVVDGVKKKGASIRNGNTRVIRVDENGIAEPDWSYVWQEDPDNDISDASEDAEGTGQRGRNYVYKEASKRRDRRRPRRQRQRPPRRIVDDPAFEEIDESEFTWADYAIPFHTPAGPPKTQLERKKRRRSRQNPLSDFEAGDEISESQQAPPSIDGNILALPPASMDGKPFDASGATNDAGATEPSRRRQRGRRTSQQENGENRKIYSVYGPSDESAEGDIIDEFGNKIADAAENFLWREDDGKKPEQYSRREANARRRKKRRSNRDAADLEDDEGPYEHDLQQKRHWRDRLADRLDAAMGVHEQGSYYQEWADRIEYEEDTKTGEDPEDWVMARHKNQRRMGLTPEERRARGAKPKRRGGVDKYFWTRDGNVMSALLGRSRSGNRAVVDELFSQPLGANVITTLIRSGFQLSLALFTNTCRWASVRGSLPQPIVVFFTGTSLVLAPKGKRFVTTAVTLFVLRALAEALHGYIYGPDGWEDDPDHLFIDDDYENDEFGEDYDADFEPSPPRNRRRRRNSHSSSSSSSSSSDDEEGADDTAS